VLVYFYGQTNIVVVLDGLVIYLYKIFVGNLERKRILGIPRRRWKDSTVVVLMETRYDVRD
jgi:hypothetical protein